MSPLSMFITNGYALAPYGAQGLGKPYLRFYGTFPRVLGSHVRDERLLTLPEAIRKMTFFAAQIFGINDRGRLRENMFADLTLWDPQTVNDRATYQEPHQYP